MPRTGMFRQFSSVLVFSLRQVHYLTLIVCSFQDIKKKVKRCDGAIPTSQI